MEHIVSIKKRDEWLIYGFGILICAGLFARDIMGVSVNKYIFLALAMVPIIFVKLDKVVPFSCFLIPLYVGLPGNLISVFLLIRLFYEAFRNKIRLNAMGFFWSYAIALYIIIQNIITGATSIYNMMAAMDFITLFLLISAIKQYNQSKEAIVFFAVGNFVLGVVMLSATLSYYSLEELMDPATRLGYTGMLMESSYASMATSIDPNFYSMNVIATLSTGCLLISQLTSRVEKIILVISMIGCTVCCLIGLSRTFVVLLLIWGVLWLLCQKNIKRIFVVLGVGCILLVAFFQFMPTVASGLLMRFEGVDVAGGNGRINLILKYYEPWAAELLSTVFGIGLFNCHTHCAPLLYLFGIGVVGIVPLIGWFVNGWNEFRRCVSLVTLRQCVPIIVTFIGFSTIPAAGAINYTFPMIISMVAVAAVNTKKESLV